MRTTTKTSKGLLANAFQSSFWDSKIKSQNTTKAEMWLGYVLGPWGVLLTNSIVNSYFNQYLTDVVGFTVSKGAWIATFMVLFPLISKLIDAITNVVMSRIIDNTVCRQGKVRPWIILSAPLVFVSIILLFWMPFANVFAQAIWVTVAFNLYYAVAYTMWNMSRELTVAVSTRNVNQRRKLSTAASLVMNMGTGLISILFPTLLAAVIRTLAGGNNATGYFYCMSIIACIALPLAFVQYFFTRERITEERRNQLGVSSGNEEIKKEVSFREQAKACLKNKYWIIFIVIVLLFWILTNLRNIALVYYSGWVVNGNQYGMYEVIQRRFQIIAMQPMFLGVFIVFPLVKKWGRSKAIWIGSTLTVIGSLVAYFGAGSSMMVYAGSALAGFGNVAFSYLLMTFLGDVIDHVEWKSGVRCDGFTGAFYTAAGTISMGIAQGIFNLGLMMTNYAQPAEIGVAGNGVKLFANQPAAATGWINMSYQGSYIVLGIIIFIVFCFLFKIEDDLPTVEKELQDRKVAECAAMGIEYIPADELERREIEAQEKEAEDIRIRELKEKCAKKGLDFDTENQKVLDQRAAAAAKAEAKRAKAEAKAAKAGKQGKKGSKAALWIVVGLVIAALAGLALTGWHTGKGPFKGLFKAYSGEVKAIEQKYDADTRKGEIVFYGASNFRLWTEMETDLSGYKVQNHGFGGSTDIMLAQYADRILYPYEPAVVFFQTGSNDYIDLSGSDDEKVAQCMAFKREMFESIHETLPDAKLVVMSGLLLPGRAQYLELTERVNAELAALCAEKDYLFFVDASAMTWDGSSFRTELFESDGIHLNHEGQLLWMRDYIQPQIEALISQFGLDGVRRNNA